MAIFRLTEWGKHHKLLILLILIATYFLFNSFRKHLPDFSEQTTQDKSATGVKDGEILLLYVYASTHSHAYGNLKYFIDTAVREGDGVDYYFLIQQVNDRAVNESELPLLQQRNAFYLQHENKCFDFGTFGWFFNEYTIGNPWPGTKSNNKHKKIDIRRYKYFIFMNSSIRGPFFPPYFIELVLKANLNYYWYSVFTRRINKDVKLVGSTISCETVPHVQTYIFATDFAGLSILLKPGDWGATSEKGIFGCYPTKDHVSIHSELPSSNRILASGYLIDSLLTKYQTINFTDPRNRFCNKNKNPYKDKGLEETSLEPFEVVFVKYNDLEFIKDSRDRAKMYQRWVEETKTFNRTHW